MRATLLTLAVALLHTVTMHTQPATAANFADDLAFLQKHTPTIVLQDKTGQAQIAVVPAWQGRVMTSTAGGPQGLSYGWLNRELIASRQTQPHINVFGGEDRFWLGPEGGQFSIFFAPGVPFDLEHWFTPAAIDTLPFQLTSQRRDSAEFAARFTLTNYSGTTFQLEVEREIRLLTHAQLWKKLGLKPRPDLQAVAFETDNEIINRGKNPWTKSTGLLSIWILGMFNPSPATTIVVPIQPGDDAALGPKVTADYFGQVPPDRLKITPTALFFSGDGQYRSKIGVSPRRSKALLGSYDAQNHVLTIVQFTQPKDAVDYVNSLWKLQDKPFGGDASNSYNDGPPSPGAKPLGPFYELESSSPAAALKPGKSHTHLHRTIHLQGPPAALDPVAQAILGVTLNQIQTALK